MKTRQTTSPWRSRLTVIEDPRTVHEHGERTVEELAVLLDNLPVAVGDDEDVWIRRRDASLSSSHSQEVCSRNRRTDIRSLESYRIELGNGVVDVVLTLREKGKR